MHLFPHSSSLTKDGEYGMKDVYLGVPVVLGRKGVEGIVQLKLNSDERSQLRAAGKKVKAMLKGLKK